MQTQSRRHALETMLAGSERWMWRRLGAEAEASARQGDAELSYPGSWSPEGKNFNINDDLDIPRHRFGDAGVGPGTDLLRARAKSVAVHARRGKRRPTPRARSTALAGPPRHTRRRRGTTGELHGIAQPRLTRDDDADEISRCEIGLAVADS
jgi:hypothetical protein